MSSEEDQKSLSVSFKLTIDAHQKKGFETRFQCVFIENDVVDTQSIGEWENNTFSTDFELTVDEDVAVQLSRIPFKIRIEERLIDFEPSEETKEDSSEQNVNGNNAKTSKSKSGGDKKTKENNKKKNNDISSFEPKLPILIDLSNFLVGDKYVEFHLEDNGNNNSNNNVTDGNKNIGNNENKYDDNDDDNNNNKNKNGSDVLNGVTELKVRISLHDEYESVLSAELKDRMNPIQITLSSFKGLPEKSIRSVNENEHHSIFCGMKLFGEDWRYASGRRKGNNYYFKKKFTYFIGKKAEKFATYASFYPAYVFVCDRLNKSKPLPKQVSETISLEPEPFEPTSSNNKKKTKNAAKKEETKKAANKSKKVDKKSKKTKNKKNNEEEGDQKEDGDEDESYIIKYPNANEAEGGDFPSIEGSKEWECIFGTSVVPLGDVFMGSLKMKQTCYVQPNYPMAIGALKCNLEEENEEKLIKEFVGKLKLENVDVDSIVNESKNDNTSGGEELKVEDSVNEKEKADEIKLNNNKSKNKKKSKDMNKQKESDELKNDEEDAKDQMDNDMMNAISMSDRIDPFGGVSYINIQLRLGKRLPALLHEKQINKFNRFVYVFEYSNKFLLNQIQEVMSVANAAACDVSYLLEKVVDDGVDEEENNADLDDDNNMHQESELLKRLSSAKSILSTAYSKTSQKSKSKSKRSLKSKSKYSQTSLVSRRKRRASVGSVKSAFSRASSMSITKARTRPLLNVRLSDEQKRSEELDILTGFTVTDGLMRVVVIEGMKDGQAVQKLMDTVGRPVYLEQQQQIIQNTSKKDLRLAKMHYNGELKTNSLINLDITFPQRLYANYELELKYIRTRHPLTHLSKLIRMALTNSSQTHSENHKHLYKSIQRLNDLMNCSRLRLAKSLRLFPTEQHINALEKEFGDFVSDEDLGVFDTNPNADRFSVMGSVAGYPRDNPNKASYTSMTQKSLLTLNSSNFNNNNNMNKSGTAMLMSPGEDSVDMDEDLMRPRIDHFNAEYLTIKEHQSNQKRNFLAENKEATRNVNKGTYVSRNELLKDFPEDQEIHIYSGQKLQYSELQRKELIEKLKKNKNTHYSYSPYYLSLSLGIGDKEELKKLEEKQRRDKFLTKDGFVFNVPKKKSEYNVHPKRPSSARIEELREPWVENTSILSYKNNNSNTDEVYLNGNQSAFSANPSKNKEFGYPGNEKWGESVHLGGDGLLKELEAKKKKEFEDWKNKVVVNNTYFKVNKMTKNKPSVVDKYKSILQDSPRKKALKFKNKRSKTMPTANLKLEPYPPSIFLNEPYEDPLKRSRDMNSSYVSEKQKNFRVPSKSSPREPTDWLYKKSMKPLSSNEKVGPKWNPMKTESAKNTSKWGKSMNKSAVGNPNVLTNNPF